MRSKLFERPAGAFDPFVSPTLFFRTSGLAIPRSWPVDKNAPSIPPTPFHSASTPEPPPWADLEFDPEFDPPSDSSYDGRSSEISEPEPAPASRKSHLWFPPKHSGLVLPRTLLGVSDKDGILADQAQEFMRLMRRSVELHEMKERKQWDEDADGEAEAKRRVACLDLGNGEHRGEVEWAREFFEDCGVFNEG
jgi:hypothetical protein